MRGTKRKSSAPSTPQPAPIPHATSNPVQAPPQLPFREERLTRGAAAGSSSPPAAARGGGGGRRGLPCVAHPHYTHHLNCGCVASPTLRRSVSPPLPRVAALPPRSRSRSVAAEPTTTAAALHTPPRGRGRGEHGTATSRNASAPPSWVPSSITSSTLMREKMLSADDGMKKAVGFPTLSRFRSIVRGAASLLDEEGEHHVSSSSNQHPPRMVTLERLPLSAVQRTTAATFPSASLQCALAERCAHSGALLRVSLIPTAAVGRRHNGATARAQVLASCVAVVQSDFPYSSSSSSVGSSSASSAMVWVGFQDGSLRQVFLLDGDTTTARNDTKESDGSAEGVQEVDEEQEEDEEEIENDNHGNEAREESDDRTASHPPLPTSSPQRNPPHRPSPPRNQQHNHWELLTQNYHRSAIVAIVPVLREDEEEGAPMHRDDDDNGTRGAKRRRPHCETVFTVCSLGIVCKWVRRGAMWTASRFGEHGNPSSCTMASPFELPNVAVATTPSPSPFRIAPHIEGVLATGGPSGVVYVWGDHAPHTLSTTPAPAPAAAAAAVVDTLQLVPPMDAANGVPHRVTALAFFHRQGGRTPALCVATETGFIVCWDFVRSDRHRSASRLGGPTTASVVCIFEVKGGSGIASLEAMPRSRSAHVVVGYGRDEREEEDPQKEMGRQRPSSDEFDAEGDNLEVEVDAADPPRRKATSSRSDHWDPLLAIVRSGQGLILQRQRGKLIEVASAPLHPYHQQQQASSSPPSSSAQWTGDEEAEESNLLWRHNGHHLVAVTPLNGVLCWVANSSNGQIYSSFLPSSSYRERHPSHSTSSKNNATPARVPSAAAPFPLSSPPVVVDDTDAFERLEKLASQAHEEGWDDEYLTMRITEELERNRSGPPTPPPPPPPPPELNNSSSSSSSEDKSVKEEDEEEVRRASLRATPPPEPRDWDAVATEADTLRQTVLALQEKLQQEQSMRLQAQEQRDFAQNEIAYLQEALEEERRGKDEAQRSLVVRDEEIANKVTLLSQSNDEIAHLQRAVAALEEELRQQQQKHSALLLGESTDATISRMTAQLASFHIQLYSLYDATSHQLSDVFHEAVAVSNQSERDLLHGEVRACQVQLLDIREEYTRLLGEQETFFSTLLADRDKELERLSALLEQWKKKRGAEEGESRMPTFAPLPQQQQTDGEVEEHVAQEPEEEREEEYDDDGQRLNLAATRLVDPADAVPEEQNSSSVPALDWDDVAEEDQEAQEEDPNSNNALALEATFVVDPFSPLAAAERVSSSSTPPPSFDPASRDEVEDAPLMSPSEVQRRGFGGEDELNNTSSSVDAVEERFAEAAQRCLDERQEWMARVEDLQRRLEEANERAPLVAPSASSELLDRGEVDSLMQRLEELQREMQSQAGRDDANLEERKRLEMELSRAHDAIDALHEQYRVLQDERDSAFQQLQEMITVTQSTCNADGDEELSTMRSALTRALQERKDAREEAKTAVNALEQSNSDLQSQLAELRTQLADRDRVLTELSADMAQQMQSFVVEREAMVQSIEEQLDRAKADEERRLLEQHQAIMALQAQLDAMTQQHEDALQRDAEQARRAQTELEGIVQQTQLENSALMTEIATLQEQLEVLQSSASLLSKQSADSEADFGGRILFLQEQSLEWKKKVVVLEALVAELRAVVEDQSGRIAKFEQSEAAFVTQIVELEQALAQKDSHDKSRLREEASARLDYETRIRSLLEKLDQQQQELVASRQLRQEKVHLEAQLQEFQWLKDENKTLRSRLGLQQSDVVMPHIERSVHNQLVSECEELRRMIALHQHRITALLENERFLQSQLREAGLMSPTATTGHLARSRSRSPAGSATGAPPQYLPSSHSHSQTLGGHSPSIAGASQHPRRHPKVAVAGSTNRTKRSLQSHRPPTAATASSSFASSPSGAPSPSPQQPALPPAAQSPQTATGEGERCDPSDPHHKSNCVWCSGSTFRTMGGTFGINNAHSSRYLQFRPEPNSNPSSGDPTVTGSRPSLHDASSEAPQTRTTSTASAKHTRGGRSLSSVPSGSSYALNHDEEALLAEAEHDSSLTPPPPSVQSRTLRPATSSQRAREILVEDLLSLHHALEQGGQAW